MKRRQFIEISISISLFLIGAYLGSIPIEASSHETAWQFQSIDTMKYSRDPAREKLGDPSFDRVIETQMRNIAETGATHVGIATPYDEEFYPFLLRWVRAARRHGLNVWFRGNWAGWEKWFGYDRITRQEHTMKTREFILTHPDLFEDGDVFSGCPECENGGPGDPRHIGDVQGHREFLITEYETTLYAFEKIGKHVANNYYSMNGDVARLVMDEETTAAVGGIVTIDHYVATPEQLARDIRDLAKTSGGQIVLGEFGAPIPDIHGEMSSEEQAAYMNDALEMLVSLPEVVGVNYWVSEGGSTQLWSNGEPREAVSVLRHFFQPPVVHGYVKNALNWPIAGAPVRTSHTERATDEAGKFETPLFLASDTLHISAGGYIAQDVDIHAGGRDMVIVLEKTEESMFFKLAKFLKFLLPFIP